MCFTNHVGEMKTMRFLVVKPTGNKIRVDTVRDHTWIIGIYYSKSSLKHEAKIFILSGLELVFRKELAKTETCLPQWFQG